MAGGVRHRPFPDQAVAAVDADMGLAAEDRGGDRLHQRAVRPTLPPATLQPPARIPVRLGQFLRLCLPVLGNAAAPDDLALRVGHALARRGHDARVDDLSTRGEIPRLPQMRVEPGEEPLHRARPDQSLAEPPDSRLVRDRVAVDPEEPPEAAPVQDLELRLRIRQA